MPNILKKFHEAIKENQIDKVKRILIKYNNEYNLTNKVDPNQNRISTFIAAANLNNDDDTYEMLKLLINNGYPNFRIIFLKG